MVPTGPWQPLYNSKIMPKIAGPKVSLIKRFHCSCVCILYDVCVFVRICVSNV